MLKISQSQISTEMGVKTGKRTAKELPEKRVGGGKRVVSDAYA